jgi:polar amino acid transport system substrate-binding protein
MNCELVEVAWDGSSTALTEKKIDVIWSSMSITDERKQVIDFTDMYYDSANVLIGAKSDDTKVDMNNADSLKGKIIGVQTATIHANFIEKYFGNAAEVKLYDTLDNALADLKAGRLDYVSESTTSLEPFLKANPDFGVSATWPMDPIFGAGVGGGVRKEDTALKDKLNAGIAEVVKSGKYDELLTHYPGLAEQIQKPQI